MNKFLVILLNLIVLSLIYLGHTVMNVSFNLLSFVIGFLYNIFIVWSIVMLAE